jgi:hypothetical protein
VSLGKWSILTMNSLCWNKVPSPLNPGMKWNSVVKSMSWRSPPLVPRLHQPHNLVWSSCENKNTFPLPQMELQFHGQSTRICMLTKAYVKQSYLSNRPWGPKSLCHVEDPKSSIQSVHRWRQWSQAWAPDALYSTEIFITCWIKERIK